MMMNRLRRMRSECGVAMVTVILVGAALTVVSSTAAVITIQDFRSGADDRRATEALGYAESGVDRLLQELRKFGYNWERLNEAGCAQPPISVPQGDLGANKIFNAYLTVFDANLPPGERLPNVGTWKPGQPWSTANDTKAVCVAHENPPPTKPMLFAITSTGEHPTATRVVRQVVSMSTRGLPIGMYAIEYATVKGGNPETISISLITPGYVDGREKLEFKGIDPYYKLGHFWAGESMEVGAPAAIHAGAYIACASSVCGSDLLEHPGPLNCTANWRAGDGRSQWDQSGKGGSLAGLAKCPQWTGSPAGPPPYSSFSDADLKRSAPQLLTEEDYALLKQAAQERGMYCAMSLSGSGTCTKPTGSFSTNGLIQDGDISGLPSNFVAYFDFPAGGDPFSSKQTVTWKAGVGPCSDNPTVNRSAIIVIRQGSVDLTGKGEIVGAFFAPEGRAWLRGSGGIVKIHGSVIAKIIDIGGNAEVLLTPCWVNNISSIFLRVRPLSWSEIDR
jgi:hypothetical protein